ncbi:MULTISPECIES: ABC-F family ATP-binding cassette domain-containing protein [Enterococcus]|uniref:ABC-F family ATP-binding cassette domain-containing protein n=1 Tax=Enterococcus TaxID=1350 RepID=UPI000D3A08EB|nr:MULTISPECIES: ATP-binding cassette domain-containing protein [Enterococcus]MDB1567357.1 ATP-binding cassette domain-containing protein [Enterococcus faecalis]MDB1570100.1 ATP-binding cassette domain-containing protein [Enterococcus faecalis]MDB1575641.1 ATP-binding cassette domain-containing protein [Enterococcus faecalis]MDB1649482.1 ATP-binding cassette domain-containing protein [Enterococcus faecalis]MDB1658311.1 ATP-binding cassette domain-containing protein [Enterococcus faecalis]
MITVNDVSLQFPDRKLFEEVNIKFTPGNCYGLIGANGAGKSTFLKILSGEIQPTTGVVSMGPNERLATLKQNHFDYEDYTVLETVIMGHKRLYEVMKEKDAIYMKEDFSDEDGIRAAELEGEFAELDGWEAEPEAAVLLQGLNIPEELHDQKMSELTAGQKVKVLLAQSLFGKPDVLLLDEPTNGLDTRSINWLEEFLINFENTVIVVSHDRHFLNKVCTHMADLDFNKIKLYVGNYDFWLESSQLATKLQAQSNAKKEEQIKELQDFIARFSANASKSKQATSRKKMLDKITLDDIQPSSRRYPFVGFTPEREIGNDLLQVENVSVTIDGKKILDNISFNLTKDDKVAFIADSDITTTTLFKVIMGEITPDTGSVRWGVTTSQAYLPKDNSKDFEEPLTILDWLRQFAGKEEDDNTFLRSFLGRMLFSGEEVLKPVNVLSGGEKVRVMLSKLMLSKANVLVLDDPTNHLDLESITALNDGLMAFTGSILFASHDHQFIQTLANRIIAVSDKGVIDRAETTYDEFLENPEIQKQMDVLFSSDY